MQRFLLFFPFLFLFSCGKSYLFEERVNIPESGWTYQDTINYTFVIEDTLKLYNILIALEHSTAFETQNLYARISTKFPDQTRLSKEISLELANKSGLWYGECSSKECLFEAPIQQNAYFNQQGEYTITLEQYMRQDSLQGVQSIGLMLEDTGVSR